MKSNKILDNLIKDVDADLHFLRRHEANIKAFAKEYHKEQLTLKDVVSCICKIPEPRLKVSENGTYSYCEKCAKTYLQI